MAAFEGFYTGDLIQLDVTHVKPEPARRAESLPPLSPHGAFVGALPEFGTLTLGGGGTTPGAKQGFYFPGFNELITERLHVAPRTVDAGLVLAPSRFESIIWNNYAASDATATAILVQDAGGIVFQGLAVDDIILAQKDLIIVHTLFPSGGPPEINAGYLYQFDLGDLNQIITGRRGVVLMVEPSELGYEEGRNWEVNVYRSQNGTEKRKLLTVGDIPNRFVVCALKPFTTEQLRQLEDTVAFGAKYNFIFPLWLSETYLSEDTDGISAVIHCDTTKRQFTTVELIAVYNRKRRVFDSRKIVSLTSSTITLNRPVNGYATGDSVMPLIVVTPEQSSRMQAFNWKRANSTLRLDEFAGGA